MRPYPIQNAHGPARFSPKVSTAQNAADGSDTQSTITLSKPNLGNVVVKASPVTAGEKVDLTIKYTATATLADSDPDGDEGTDDSTYGRIRVTLPAGWGPEE